MRLQSGWLAAYYSVELNKMTLCSHLLVSQVLYQLRRQFSRLLQLLLSSFTRKLPERKPVGGEEIMHTQTLTL